MDKSQQLINLLLQELTKEFYNPNYQTVPDEYLEPYPESVTKYDLAALERKQGDE